MYIGIIELCANLPGLLPFDEVGTLPAYLDATVSLLLIRKEAAARRSCTGEGSRR